jgi:hypothetical protein
MLGEEFKENTVYGELWWKMNGICDIISSMIVFELTPVIAETLVWYRGFEEWNCREPTDHEAKRYIDLMMTKYNLPYKKGG